MERAAGRVASGALVQRTLCFVWLSGCTFGPVGPARRQPVSVASGDGALPARCRPATTKPTILPMASTTRPNVWAKPVESGGQYRFESGELGLSVDAALGARVTEFSYSGFNVLVGSEVVAHGDANTANLHGSTFWTSPQADWGWPPEVAIDSARYVPCGVGLGQGIALRSAPGLSSGYAVEKRFALAPDRAIVEYRLHNVSATRPAAPWEVTRVPRSGLFFYPVSGKPLAASTLQAPVRDGVAWVDVSQAPARDTKLFQGSAEGWSAFILEGHAFLKIFPSVEPSFWAPGEADVELFINGSFDYIEIEQQGPFLPTGLGQWSQPWRLAWLLRPLPEGLRVEVGSAELVEWVRAQIRES